MYRLTQIIRNSFIRIEGLLYQVLGVFGKLFGLVNQLFLFLGGVFGFNKSQYFLEDEVQDSKPAEAESNIPESPPEYSSATNATRRRPDTDMEYFLKMTRREKK